MSANNNTAPAPSFVSRVISSDTAKRGVAGAIASVLVACLTEALWPSS